MHQQSTIRPTVRVDYTALHRALTQGLRARRVSPSCYRVTSSDGAREYEVCLGAAVRCQCAAGIEGRGCKHVALVQVLSAAAELQIERRAGDGLHGIADPDGAAADGRVRGAAS